MLLGNVSIFGDSQIPSTAVTQQLDILRNTSSYARTLLGIRLGFAADSDRRNNNFDGDDRDSDRNGLIPAAIRGGR